jgi:RNA polymerase sigma factor (sigma-70 family)
VTQPDDDDDDTTDAPRNPPSAPPPDEDTDDAGDLDGDLDDVQTEDVPTALPTELPGALLQDIADRRGFALLGTAPGPRRALDEPLVLATIGVRADRDQDDEDLRRLVAHELTLTAWVLTQHWPVWEAFCAVYSKKAKDQPPGAREALAVASACRAALAHGQRVPDAVQTTIPRPVRARLHRWCRTHHPDPDLDALSDEITSLRERILLRNGRLAHFTARRVYHQGLTWRERLAFGIAGLSRALDSFEPERGATFATYARNWIRARVSRAANETGTPMRCSGGFAELRMNVARHARERIWLANDAHPQPPTVARATPDRRALVDTGLVLETAEPHQLAALVDVDASTTENLRRWEALWCELDRALADLNHRQRTILERRWGLDPARTRHTLSEIGEQENLSRERIRQLEREAIGRLRDQLLRDGGALADSISPTSSASPSSSS